MAVEKLIVGLGNPGGEYRATRHNAGFILVDRLASRWGIHWRSEKRFFAEFADVVWNGQRVGMAKPQTFMNLSGKAVEAIAGFFRVEPGNILVVVDDADLPLGTIRLRGDGSPGGHHGLESVEQCLGSRAYPRLRLGIARPESGVRRPGHAHRAR